MAASRSPPTEGASRPGPPRTAHLPDFVTNVEQRVRLTELGYKWDFAHPERIEAPDGRLLTPGAAVTFQPGGGAVSVIRDAPITKNFDDRKDGTLTAPSGEVRPWFATAPFCELNVVENNVAKPGCAKDVVDRFFDYHAPDEAQFARPSGVAIYPYVAFDSPRFGDRVHLATPVIVQWRDASVRALDLEVLDLDQLSGAGDPIVQNRELFTLEAEQLAEKTAQAEFAALFGDVNLTGAGPRPGHRYRVIIRALIAPETENPEAELSRTSIDVVFETNEPLQPNELTLAPSLGAASLVGASGTLQMRATFTPAGPSSTQGQDVTSAADTCYRSTVGSTCTGEGPLDESLLAAARDRIRTALTTTAGTPVAFNSAAVSIAGGLVSVSSPGIQIVEAKHGSVRSKPSVILAGFQIDRMDLEPIVESSIEAGTLGSRVLAQFQASSNEPINAPIVIAPTDSIFVDDDAQIVLERVVLRYSGGGTINLNELMAAIRPLIADQFNTAIAGPSRQSRPLRRGATPKRS